MTRTTIKEPLHSPRYVLCFLILPRLTQLTPMHLIYTLTVVITIAQYRRLMAAILYTNC